MKNEVSERVPPCFRQSQRQEKINSSIFLPGGLI